ncbi:MAG: DNA repair protein RadC [Desulfobacterales bacterium]|uniref:DNA repair protein RadC n=1 Tax=Candidatus Desulfatibia vada TaxID=2841696 RepID=A0A8J6NZW9_9BACT|nr:DNA repair protein RadC [Candidatus Desulfatibia vada]
MAKRNIKNLPEHERPREKLIERGAVALTDHELLAVLIGKGSPRHDAITLAKKMIPVIDEKGAKLSVDDLAKFDGIGNAKAALILAAIEFSRRRIRPEGIRIETPADLVPHIRHYVDRKQEHFLCASVNGANEIINIRVVSIGLVDRSHVHPREVFADPLIDRASAVILAHNHPVGALNPSEQDIETTQRLRQAGEIMGIAVLDHIIFNSTEYFSFLESDIGF